MVRSGASPAVARPFRATLVSRGTPRPFRPRYHIPPRDVTRPPGRSGGAEDGKDETAEAQHLALRELARRPHRLDGQGARVVPERGPAGQVARAGGQEAGREVLGHG